MFTYLFFIIHSKLKVGIWSLDDVNKIIEQIGDSHLGWTMTST